MSMADTPRIPNITETDIPTLERRVAELERARVNELQGRLRALADLENYRQRTKREAGGTRRAGQREVLLPLLDVHDNLERALAAGSTDPAFLRGVEAIAEQLRQTVTRLGAVPIPGVGTRFDPRLHEAVGTVPATDHPPDTIVTEIRRGFLLDGEVLRPGQVVVAQATPADGSRQAHRSPEMRRGAREG
jgi:molecular chaperone GrpE